MSALHRYFSNCLASIRVFQHISDGFLNAGSLRQEMVCAICLSSAAFTGIGTGQTQTFAFPTPHSCGDPVDKLNHQISYYNGDGKTITCASISVIDPSTGKPTTIEQKGPDGFRYECVEFVRRYYRIAKGCNLHSACNTAQWADYDSVSFFSHATQFGLESHINGQDASMPVVEDVVGYQGGSDGRGHVAIIKEIKPTANPNTWLVYVIEQNVIPGATALPLVLVKDASSGFYTLNDRFLNGAGVGYGYSNKLLTGRLGPSYLIQGWMRLPSGPSTSIGGLDSEAWPTLGHDNQRTNQAVLPGPTFPIAASPSLLYDAGRSIGINQVVVTSDGKILLTACIGQVVGLNSSGQPFGSSWPFPLLSTEYPNSPESPVGITVSGSGTIYVATHECPDIPGPVPTHFYSIGFNGVETANWPISTHAQYWPAAIGSDSTIYQMDEFNQLHGYSVSGNLVWTVGLPSFGQGDIALDSLDNIYVGTDANLVGGHALYSFTSSGSSRANWPNDTDGITAQTTPVIDVYDGVYITNTAGTLFGFNPDGSLKKGFPVNIGGSVSQQPLALSSLGIIYMKTSNGLFALNPDGTNIWSSPFAPGGDASLSAAPLLDSNGYIYVAFGNSIYCLNADGTIRSGWPITVPNAGTIVIGSDKVLYVVSAGQKLYSISGLP